MKPEINPDFFMQKQLEIIFENVLVTQMDLLIAKLFELGVNGMEESTNGLIAYAYVDQLDEESLNQFSSGAGLTFSIHEVKEQNWNAIWESNFDPVRLGDFVGIRAHFHPDFEPAVEYDIKITPKMSFGTGHHPTTFSVMQLMQRLDFKGKTVYDFGTGTGILAILAEKLGAKKVHAVDNDDWCIENALENIQNNASKVITIEKVASALQKDQYDIVLANVNRHIIEANMEELTLTSKPGGILVLSGLLIEDQLDMIELAGSKSWIFQEAQPLDGWVSLLFNR